MKYSFCLFLHYFRKRNKGKASQPNSSKNDSSEKSDSLSSEERPSGSKDFEKTHINDSSGKHVSSHDEMRSLEEFKNFNVHSKSNEGSKNDFESKINGDSTSERVRVSDHNFENINNFGSDRINNIFEIEGYQELAFRQDDPLDKIPPDFDNAILHRKANQVNLILENPSYDQLNDENNY